MQANFTAFEVNFTIFVIKLRMYYLLEESVQNLITSLVIYIYFWCKILGDCIKNSNERYTKFW